MFVLEYRYDGAKRTTFGSHFGTMRSRQGSNCHVATSPLRDVTKSRRLVNKRRSQQITTSRCHHVATSPRRDVTTSRRHHVATSPSRYVTTSRRQLENLHLIIKCQTARKFRASGSVRREARNFRACNTDFKELLGFLYCFLNCFDYFGSHDDVFHTIYFVSFFHDVLNPFLGLYQTFSQTMD